MADLNGKALTAVSIGMLFVWSGIKGWSIVGTAGDLITGVKPQQVAMPLTNADASAASSPEAGIGVAGGGDIVSAAMAGQGHAYRFGGAPVLNVANPLDCSIFVNWTLSVKLGRRIPGYGPGQYKGTVHGPPTGTWAVWDGLQRVSRNNLAPGDIIVWLGHMGIAISNTQMISALNPKLGTRVGQIEGAARGPIVTMGRLK